MRLTSWCLKVPLCASTSPFKMGIIGIKPTPPGLPKALAEPIQAKRLDARVAYAKLYINASWLTCTGLWLVAVTNMACTTQVTLLLT